MNTKVLTSLSAALVVLSFAAPAFADPAIATGYSARGGESSLTTTSNVRSNTPASLDWTATIGTGTAASFRSTKAPLSSGTVATAPATHWSAKIGSGHAKTPA